MHYATFVGKEDGSYTLTPTAKVREIVGEFIQTDQNADAVENGAIQLTELSRILTFTYTTTDKDGDTISKDVSITLGSDGGSQARSAVVDDTPVIASRSVDSDSDDSTSSDSDTINLDMGNYRLYQADQVQDKVTGSLDDKVDVYVMTASDINQNLSALSGFEMIDLGTGNRLNVSLDSVLQNADHDIDLNGVSVNALVIKGETDSVVDLGANANGNQDLGEFRLADDVKAIAGYDAYRADNDDSLIYIQQGITVI